MGEQLSMLDTMFLELEQSDESAHMHIGAALVFDPLPGRRDAGHRPTSATTCARASASCRASPSSSPAPHAGPLTWLTWEPAEAFDVDAHVHHATLPAPGGEAELHEWLGDFWSHRLDRHRPLWEMTLLDGLQGGRWALATKTHHCLVDGVGSVDIGHLLLDDSPQAAPPPPQPLPDRIPHDGEHGTRPVLALARLGRARRAGRPRRGAASRATSLDHMRAAVELIVREEVIAAPQSSLNGPMSGTRHFATVQLDLADIKAIKTRMGGTVNDVVLALCAGGLRHLLLSRGDDAAGRRPARAGAGEHPHRGPGARPRQRADVAVRRSAGGRGGPDQRATARSLERAARLKSGSQRTGGKTIIDLADMGPPLAGALLARSMFGSTRMFNLTITNVPGPQQRLYAFGAPLVEILPLVPLFAGHTIGIAVVSYAGQIVFGLNADRVAAPDVNVLAEGIERSFAELCPPRAKRRRPRRAVAAAS